MNMQSVVERKMHLSTKARQTNDDLQVRCSTDLYNSLYYFKSRDAID